MRILLIKTSSLGDVVHALPALTDAMHAIPGIKFDWVVEESLAEIPGWHPAVDKVIPVAIRRWRRRPLATLFSNEWKTFRKQIKARYYDKVIDAQGLMKSALLSRMAKGDKCGLHGSVARESLAALAYREKFKIAKGQHAIQRVRQLFANCLAYAEPTEPIDYGIDASCFTVGNSAESSIVFLHGTTWSTKLWPESYWIALAKKAGTEGFQVLLPWGNNEEKQRAERIAMACATAQVLDRCTIEQMATHLANARAVVAVDTGLGHLAAALSIPSVTIYGATKPGLTGTMGTSQLHLCADFPCSPCLQRRCSYRGEATVSPACYASVDPERVWQKTSTLIS